MDVLLVSHFHILDSIVETLDDGTSHAFEFDGLPTEAGSIEYFTVIKRARVVDLDYLAFVAHGLPPIS